MHNLKYFKILKKFTSAMAKFFCLIFSFKLSRKFDRCTAIAANVLRLGGRFNAAKPLLYAGTVN